MSDLKIYKRIPEGSKQIAGLVGLTVTIIAVFSFLNIFVATSDKNGEGDETGESNQIDLSALPKGKLNFYESDDGYQLSQSEYENLCKGTKIVTQRAMMGANITNFSAHKLYMDNGNKIDKFSVKWDASSNKCFAEYTIRALEGVSDAITVSGQAKGFLKTGLDTRVYFIKNF